MTPRVGYLSYVPFPRQAEFHDSPARYRLFGGSAGPGKSTALCMEAARQCLHVPRWNALILRETFPELEQSQIQKFRSMVPGDLYSWNDQKKIATFRSNDSTLRFGYCASDDDVYRYQSDEYGFVGFDELTHFSLFQWLYMGSRNRSTTGARPNMAAGTNPGGKGHVWVKALWIDRRPAPGMEPSQYNTRHYAFIPAKLADNPRLLELDPTYVERLMLLPEGERKALLDGSWDHVAGAYFDIWDPTKHVQETRIESWWPRWIGGDWGFSHDFAFYWGATDPTQTTWVYREWVDHGLTGDRLAMGIADRSEHESIEDIFLSPDAWAKKQSERTVALEMDEVFQAEGLPSVSMADTDRVGGWQLLYQEFQAGRLKISPKCTRLIECLPSLIRDKDHPEDVLKVDGDDPGDGVRYLIKTRMRSVRKPREQRLRELVTSKDPNEMHMQHLAALEKLRGEGDGNSFTHSRIRRRHAA